MSGPCQEPGCGGAVQADGYCDTCGTKAAAASTGRRARRKAEVAAAVVAAAIAAPGSACGEAGCAGTVSADGYCDTCGTKAAPAAVAAGGQDAAERSRPSRIGRTLVTGSARAKGSRRTASHRTRSTSQRFSIGVGIVDIPVVSAADPATVVMAEPRVDEDKRFCSKCAAPVGRGKGGRPGREKGFCGSCRQPYDFVPKLAAGQLVGGQYEVLGPIAHGGLGWIYLARDKAVNDRWVVLKGLLDAGDEAASAAAVAEKRFLAEVQHPNIVEIYNFVTHKGAGYIVMEYVGGLSLKQILKRRRLENGEVANPLPVDQAIAYVLAALPAFAYLHERRLVYCDFKPDNLIHIGDQVKLIDLGGVRRVDDTTSDVYGTVGFQAPEVPDAGPSVASDVYTIGRTLAVLTLDFRGYQGAFAHALPDPAEHAALADHESFHRLLLKATAPHPDDRFQSVGELSDQLAGVLREVVAMSTGRAQPGQSTLFVAGSEHGLPSLAIDPSDPAAAFLANLPSTAPDSVLVALDDALSAQQIADTVEVRLRRARALLDAGNHAAASEVFDAIEADDPWEWRAVWLRGVAALAHGDHASALAAFERCLAEVPGELAPKLASAMAAEAAGDVATATALYDVVSSVDPAYVSASNGLARCRLAAGDVPGALAAFDRVPRTHRAWEASRLEAARALATAGRFTDAVAQLDGLTLTDHERFDILLEVFDDALAAITTGKVPPDARVDVAGYSFTESGMRRAIEHSCRRLADLTPDRDERYRLVDRANAVRPLSFA